MSPRSGQGGAPGRGGGRGRPLAARIAGGGCVWLGGVGSLDLDLGDGLLLIPSLLRGFFG